MFHLWDSEAVQSQSWSCPEIFSRQTVIFLTSIKTYILNKLEFSIVFTHKNFILYMWMTYIWYTLVLRGYVTQFLSPIHPAWRHLFPRRDSNLKTHIGLTWFLFFQLLVNKIKDIFRVSPFHPFLSPQNPEKKCKLFFGPEN